MSKAVALGRTAGQTYLTMIATTGLGEAQEMLGLLGQAVQTYQKALQLASEYSSEPMPFAGLAYVGLAGPLYERNDLDGAKQCVTTGIELSTQARNIDTIKDGYASLALLQQALGNPDRAIEAIRKLEDLAQKSGDSNWRATAYAFQSQWWLKRGDTESAARCAQKSRLRACKEADFVCELAEIAAARVLIAQASSLGTAQSDEARQAVTSLAALLRAAQEAKRMGSVIKILALQALAYRAQSDMDQAMSALGRALSLAEPEGYVRTFVDEGIPMARLLYKAVARGIRPDYAGKLLAAFPDREARPVAPSKISKSEILEPLSERELEVLQLITEGLTNPEIAARLYLSTNTVKAHTRNIYGKLDVHSRTQAVARARALGVLAST
jgi:LuxR family maltose regulon positive regulatory protein